jgi:phosphoglycolate phosphatase
MPDLIIFDFDGTLADTWRDIATALNRTLRESGLPEASDQQVRAWIGEGVTRLLERAVPEASRPATSIDTLLPRFRAHYARCCLDTTRLYPGIADCLAALSGHTLAILSNKPALFLDRIVGALGVAHCFAALVGGDALAVRKPDPALVQHVAHVARAAPDRVWMVGDSAIDVATGRAAGARCIGCTWGLRGAAELRAAGADFLVDHPAEIPPLIGAP